MTEKTKTLTANEIRSNERDTTLRIIKKTYNLSVGEASNYAGIIDSYKYGGNFKKGNKYKGDDKIILKFLHKSKIQQKKNTSILNK
jgi:hypothetical protein